MGDDGVRDVANVSSFCPLNPVAVLIVAFVVVGVKMGRTETFEQVGKGRAIGFRL